MDYLAKPSLGWFICSNSTFAFFPKKLRMNCGKWAFSNKRSNSSQEPLQRAYHRLISGTKKARLKRAES